MIKSKRQRMGLVALLITLVGFAVDRLLFPSHVQSASASDTPASALDAAPTDGLAPDFARNLLESSFPSGLEPSRKHDSRGDPAAFAGVIAGFSRGAPSAGSVVPDVFAWDRLNNAGPGAAQTPADGSEPGGRDMLADFKARHQLQGTVLGPNPMVTISGRTLRIGDSIGGLRLKAVRDGEAQFISDHGSVVLRVSRAAER